MAAAKVMGFEEAREVRPNQRSRTESRLFEACRDHPFVDLVKLAAQVCAAPVGTVALFDVDGVQFTSTVGAGGRELSARATLWDATARAHELFVVEDGRADARFASDPLVQGGLCFYAGVPLVRPDGGLVGVLAVLDRRPRALDEAQRAALRTLARQVVAQIELLTRDAELRQRVEAELVQARRAADEVVIERARLIERLEQALRARRHSEARLRQLVETNPYAVAMLDRDMRYLFASRRWLADYRVGLTNEQIRGRSHYDVFPEIPAAWREVHRRCLAGEVVKSEADAFLRADGHVDWLRWEVRPWRDDRGEVGGLLIFTEDVSDRKRAEDQLRRWEHAFQNASWGMALSSPDNRFIAVNRAFAAMHGGDPASWEGRPITDMFAEESKALVPKVVAHVEQGRALSYESVHVRADGSTFPVLTEVSGLTDEQGNIIFRAANFQDITDRKRAARELELERMKLWRLLAGAPIGAIAFEGPEHVVTFFNPVLAELAGGRVRMGRPIVDSLPELAGSDAMRVVDEVWRTGQTRTVRELQSPLLVDGLVQQRWFDLTCQPLSDSSGNVTSVLAFAVEVTEHVLSRQRLEAAKQVTETITSNATLGLVMMDARQHCTFMNPAAETITGFRLEEVQGRPLHDFTHPTRPDGTPYPMAECPIDSALPKRNRQAGEEVFIHKDGHFYPVAFTASPLLEAGRPVGTVIEVRDTTKEKLAQRERETMLRDLREAVDARDEFLSIAAHELRTPLTPLQLHLDNLRQLLRRAGVEETRIVAGLETAARQTRRLEKLVENLLDVSRISAGRLTLQLEPCDLAEVVREVAERFAADARAAGSVVLVHADEPVGGRWDRLRIEQLISNLLSNAIKYGGQKPVAIRVEPGAGTARLSVEDQGIGIAEPDLERIFGRFERAASVRHFGGLGLGLYIAHQIVDAHGGTIVARSTPGRGSTFTVVLPREPLRAYRAPEAPAPSAPL